MQVTHWWNKKYFINRWQPTYLELAVHWSGVSDYGIRIKTKNITYRQTKVELVIETISDYE